VGSDVVVLLLSLPPLRFPQRCDRRATPVNEVRREDAPFLTFLTQAEPVHRKPLATLLGKSSLYSDTCLKSTSDSKCHGRVGDARVASRLLYHPWTGSLPPLIEWDVAFQRRCAGTQETRHEIRDLPEVRRRKGEM
jgi:hypothetical protein